ncbi:hypothetical protein L596_022204 [Steinernema carpocapsae]|uniref:Uncharacterized protein n=1 Tax=Steinernema carpocapsae TaxID=34508 RepID=A0A4U5ML14_STECR|nr:hypothetical protein L596_022204 [Steinernema carpocapsae]
MLFLSISERSPSPLKQIAFLLPKNLLTKHVIPPRTQNWKHPPWLVFAFLRTLALPYTIAQNQFRFGLSSPSNTRHTVNSQHIENAKMEEDRMPTPAQESGMDPSTTCGGRVPIKVRSAFEQILKVSQAAASMIAILNILFGCVGLPVVFFYRQTFAGYTFSTVLILAGAILLYGIFAEKHLVLSYFRTYQWLMNLIAALTLFALIFLEFNIPTFISKYWPEQDRDTIVYYNEAERFRGYMVLSGYVLLVTSYLTFGVFSMHVVKKCMKFFQYMQKDHTNYVSYR